MRNPVLPSTKAKALSCNPGTTDCCADREVPGVRPIGPPPPMPPCPAKKMRNKRGWKAPVGHYFGNDGELFTDAGEMILDMMIAAQLCGEPTKLAPGVESPAPDPVSEPASVAEVTSESSFSDLQTATDYSASESTSYGGGSSSCDSGSGDCGADNSDLNELLRRIRGR